MDIKVKLRRLLATATARKHGWSLLAISKATGIDYASLNKFVNDEARDISVTNAERLMEFFDVQLTDGKIPQRNRK